jgi:hypothetical protein
MPTTSVIEHEDFVPRAVGQPTAENCVEGSESMVASSSDDVAAER